MRSIEGSTMSEPDLDVTGYRPRWEPAASTTERHRQELHRAMARSSDARVHRHDARRTAIAFAGSLTVVAAMVALVTFVTRDDDRTGRLSTIANETPTPTTQAEPAITAPLEPIPTTVAPTLRRCGDT